MDAIREFTYMLLEEGDQPFFRSAFVDNAAQYIEAQGYDLRGLPIRPVHKSYRVFNGNFLTVSRNKEHEEYCRLCPVLPPLHAFLRRRTPEGKMSCCNIRQVCTWGMCNNHVPPPRNIMVQSVTGSK